MAVLTHVLKYTRVEDIKTCLVQQKIVLLVNNNINLKI